MLKISREWFCDACGIEIKEFDCSLTHNYGIIMCEKCALAFDGWLKSRRKWRDDMLKNEKKNE